MIFRHHPSPSRRGIRSAFLIVLALGAVLAATAIVGVFGEQLSAAWPQRAPGQGVPGQAAPGLAESDGGRMTDDATVFDDEVAAVANLDPELRDALRRAATDAASDDIVFLVNSGWRSPEYQDELLREAVAEYGSEAEAARWVATPETSPHVQGDAVDLGPFDATYWLSQYGAAYGLCQIYANESWHFELRPEAVEAGCPDLYADPTEDPRMRR
ncbi:M15 family metallopeptidase [Agromyces allii]|uniref:D-alanyl-D-alanine carboxypeptidase-like core domain-containing protein n=1 Tax=Agromyces allii TaxID=393607 RepID=A0ABN2RBU3_9MICO|nr:M15 family metallopeptidase [Agromyces allii]